MENFAVKRTSIKLQPNCVCVCVRACACVCKCVRVFERNDPLRKSFNHRANLSEIPKFHSTQAQGATSGCPPLSLSHSLSSCLFLPLNPFLCLPLTPQSISLLWPALCQIPCADLIQSVRLFSCIFNVSEHNEHEWE